MQRRMRWLTFFALGLAPGACSEDTDNGSAETQVRAYCEDVAACESTTVSACEERLASEESVAQQAGCGAEYSRTLSCVSSNPSTCEMGELVPHEECLTIAMAGLDCMLGATATDDLCSISSSPCEICRCEACPCDQACIDDTAVAAECIGRCIDAATYSACIRACVDAAPAYLEMIECTTDPTICPDVCSTITEIDAGAVTGTDAGR